MSDPIAQSPEATSSPAEREESDSVGRLEILRPKQIFDPVARALDVIGDRWSLVLVRQLLLGSKGFQELRVRTGIAPKVLSSRLQKLREDDFVTTEAHGTRSLYALTEKGRGLSPIVSSIARWWVREGINALEVDARRFTETSALSVLEALPHLLREDAAGGARVVFEIRLTGEGGGVFTVEIREGECFVRPEFAEGADVRYTASARDWCAVALGLLNAREAVRDGRLHKEGGPQAMDQFFYQIARNGIGGVDPERDSESLADAGDGTNSETPPTRKGDTP